MTFSQAIQYVRTVGVWLSLIAFLAGGVGVSTGTAQQTRPDTTPSITLPNTHVHVLHSRFNGRTYLIQVALPNAYVNARPGDSTRYSTLYLLDVLRGLLPFLYGLEVYGTPFGRATSIIVGVTAIDPNDRKWFDRSEFDYTPPLTAADSQYFTRTGLGRPPLVGGAPQFLRVLKEEIIPLIDKSYRTSSDRGIVGGSMGGLFVAYAMLEEPDLFTRYAMISPSLWYPWGREKGTILEREPEFAKQHPTFQKTLYINIGSEENSAMIAATWQFVKQLCVSLGNGYYKGLDLGAETVAGMAHVSALAIVRARRALYPWDSTDLKIGRGVMHDCR